MRKTKLLVYAMAIVVIAYVTVFNYGGCGGGGGGGTSGSSTPPATTPPVVATLPATNVTLTSATLNGTVTPNGVSTSVVFQFGTSITYGSNTASQNIGSGTAPITVTATITGLSFNITYNFRIRATTTGGIAYLGANRTFITGLPPICSTVPATDITSNSATLNGTVNPNGVATTAYFNYGVTTSYTVTTTAQAIGNGASNVAVTATLSGLSASTQYNFRIVATNVGGTTNGLNQTFTTATLPLPICTTNPATNIASDSAKLNGQVNPNGTATAAYFNYGLTTSYGSSTTSQSIGNGTTNVALTADISGLSGSTLYNFRAVGTSSAGTTNGNNLTFTTGAPFGSAPTCTTDPANNITTNSAILNGTVIPNGVATTAWFEYGITATPITYPLSTTAQAIGSSITSVAVSATVSSLTPNTSYNFRVVAINSGGTTNAPNQTFNTAPIIASSLFVQQPTNTTAGDTITPPVTVRVTDQFNNPLLGVPVYMIVLGGSPTLYGTSPQTTDASGTATFNNLSIQVAGTGYRLRASVTP